MSLGELAENQSSIPFDTAYCPEDALIIHVAENQSSIPFDILSEVGTARRAR